MMAARDISNWERWNFGVKLASLCQLATFFFVWGFCITEFGPLLGVTLGWAPALAFAVLVGGLMFLSWRLAYAGTALAAVAAGYGVVSLFIR
jgi:hypothetical protein